jgi:uncharacterized protein YecT (DUF1311 family)
MATHKKLCLIVLAVCCLPRVVAANQLVIPTDDIDACTNRSTVEAKQCLYVLLTNEDNRLNVAYKNLLTLNAGRPSISSELKTWERAWLVERDARCKYESDYEGGGTLTSVSLAYCKVLATRLQAITLEADLPSASSGASVEKGAP